ncbi:MAG: HMA2 domain-containing protein [Thermodesulfobacteriota bacterium]
MNRSASFVHTLAGRLRIKIPEIKGNPMKAQEMENQFNLLTGMEQVAANPVTGSLLLIYDPHLLKQEEIYAVLEEMGYFHDSSGRQASFLSSDSGNEGVVEKITTTLASGLMEVALTRLVTALII